MSRIHVRAPGSGSSGGLPGNIGLDPSAPGMQKAAQYWEMLDELHKSDPEAYQKLIDEQVHAGRKKSRTRQFLPTPGFVLKTFSLAAATGRRKLFINIVAFDGVEPPTSGNGKVLDEEAHGYQARSIPLLVSPLREVPILKGGDVVNCVDVVFNPWVLRKCDQESSFKQQVIRLAIRWVQDETSLVVSIPDARVINSLYKGGRGPNLRDPVPFPITLSEEEMRELYPEEHQKQQQQQQKSAKPPVMQNPSDLLQAFRAGAETAAGESGGANVPGLHVASGGSGTSAPAPAGAAAAGESFSNAQQHSALDGLLNVSARPEVRSADGTTRTDPRANGPSRSEIREVVSDGGRSSNSTSSASQRHPGIREVIDPKDANASKKKKGAIRKGFIFRQKKKKGQVKPLYPEGSQEHKPENPYPWANVIDLGSSDQDKLKRQMEEYAQTGNVNEPTFRAKQPEPKRLAEWDPRYKAQQDCEAKEKKEANLKAQKQREAKARAALSQEEEAELDKLMAAADSGFGNLSASTEVSEGAEFYDTLKSAMAMMGGSSTALGGSKGAEGLFNDPESLQQFEEMTKQIMSAQGSGVTPSEAASSDASALGEKLKGWAGSKSQPKNTVRGSPDYSLKTITDKHGASCEKVVIHLPEVASMDDVDLQLSESELKLSAKNADGSKQKLRVTFCSNVDSSACKAKFKKGKLTVTAKHR